MSKIRIKNFGPVKVGLTEDGGWLDIDRVTIFIGNQGSGKSTVAKLISTFTWMEKALTRGDNTERDFMRKGHFKKQRLAYHRLENYDPDDTAEIEYHGDAYHFKYIDGNLTIQDANNGAYPLPQIMYVPAERNFISNVRTPGTLKLISPSLSEFVTEFYNAGAAMKGPMLLPINEGVYIEYQKLNNIFYLSGKDYRIRLTESSSGFQSLVPLFVVSWFLSDSVKNERNASDEILSSQQRERFRRRFREINENLDLTEELRRVAISELGKEFTKAAFINVVEEAEQNLFPLSQLGMLKELLKFNNSRISNKLIITTHSPYVINYLTLAVKAGLVREAIEKSQKNSDLSKKIDQIFPEASMVKNGEYVIYELDEADGSIKKLPKYNGLPSDENYLNTMLEETNEFFAQLLEIEQSK